MRYLSLITLFIALGAYGQDSILIQKLSDLESAKSKIESSIGEIEKKIESVKLEMVHSDLMKMGFPSEENLVHHKAFSLQYAEKYEQALWVAHIIRPEIIEGGVHRTNDFRIDTLVSTGSTEEADYFLKTPDGAGDFDYDGFGYDRGHLAPSADFRWSRTALSESYYYSNMSPQLPGFNREKWADLENQLRAYIVRNPESQLYVVTGPVFGEDEPEVVGRSKNGVAIPQAFFKVAFDPVRNQAVGFVLPHREDIAYPLETFIMSVDEVEEKTGLDFFPKMESKEAELKSIGTEWLPDLDKGDVPPMSAVDLPRGHFNTVDAKIYMGEGAKIKVVGTAVSTRESRKGNVLVNLDKQFPNQIFTIFIKKENLVNFSYDPVEYLKGKQIVVNGKIDKMGGTPVIYLESEKQISVFEK